jgi:hypothetical protein
MIMTVIINLLLIYVQRPRIYTPFRTLNNDDAAKHTFIICISKHWQLPLSSKMWLVGTAEWRGLF